MIFLQLYSMAKKDDSNTIFVTDPACENPAKIFFGVNSFLNKIILYIKNLL